MLVVDVNQLALEAFQDALQDDRAPQRPLLKVQTDFVVFLPQQPNTLHTASAAEVLLFFPQYILLNIGFYSILLLITS